MMSRLLIANLGIIFILIIGCSGTFVDPEPDSRASNILIPVKVEWNT